MVANKGMEALESRVNSFSVEQQVSKRRASAQGTRKQIAQWPHKFPDARALAAAGFYFNPGPGSSDNVACFFCGVALDGWQETDVPIKEHLDHGKDCQWAQAYNAGLNAQELVGSNTVAFLSLPDPMCPELVAARRATFEKGTVWPHEKKRAWKCKISKMVDAGWCYDPEPPQDDDDCLDNATCFYCMRGVGGWEPKDDPVAEHKRGSPDCPFFILVNHYGSAGGRKPRGGAKTVRASNASKISRLSAQSVQSSFSTFSEQQSLGTLSSTADLLAETDDSMVTAATTASQSTITGKSASKRTTKARAPAKSTRTRQRAGTVEFDAGTEPLYPDLSQSQAQTDLSTSITDQAVANQVSTKPARKGGRQSKQATSSLLESASSDLGQLPKKGARGKKAKIEPKVEDQSESDVFASVDQSFVSAQLLDELDRSLSIEMDAKFETDERTPQPEPPKAKRGTKRMSDGARKQQETVQDEPDSSVMIVDFPAPPVAKGASKAKKGRKASKQQQQQISENSQIDSALEPAADAAAQTRKAAPKKSSKGRKGSSTRSSRSSKATITAIEPPSLNTDPENDDIEADEREIEAELARIADEEARHRAESAMQVETDKQGEFEPSPTSREKTARASANIHKHVDVIQHLESELEAEVQGLTDPGKNLETYVDAVARPSPKVDPTAAAAMTASPSGSDKENAPSSALHPKAIPPSSPSKAVRVPLAPGTPNRPISSPTKQLHRQATSVPWKPIDLDTILLASPQPPLTPGTMRERLACAAGSLPSAERDLTVEQWISLQAEKVEVELRRRGEALVAKFEQEGNRALESLGGMEVAGH